jgi:pseudooxynicotine dehydrogenase
MELRESSPDVVIVGGRFAGVTAASELTMRGRSAVLVEARDRLGGRTPHVGPRRACDGTRWNLGPPLAAARVAKISRYGVARDIDNYLRCQPQDSIHRRSHATA